MTENEQQLGVVEVTWCDMPQGALEDKQQECNRLNLALENLQNVLEQFQAEQDGRMQSEMAVLHREMERRENKIQQLQQTIDAFTVRCLLLAFGCCSSAV